MASIRDVAVRYRTWDCGQALRHSLGCLVTASPSGWEAAVRLGRPDCAYLTGRGGA